MENVYSYISTIILSIISALLMLLSLKLLKKKSLVLRVVTVSIFSTVPLLITVTLFSYFKQKTMLYDIALFGFTVIFCIILLSRIKLFKLINYTEKSMLIFLNMIYIFIGVEQYFTLPKWTSYAAIVISFIVLRNFVPQKKNQKKL